MTSSTDSSLQHGDGRRWIIMGVCGCGKTTAGAALAARLGVPFLEGDAYHPAANVEKMSAGIALDDGDRSGWLATLKSEIAAAKARGEGLVLACSALKRRYRDLLREADPDLRFVHLDGAPALIAQRMLARTAHFMPTSLLDSQLRDLEPLDPDERGLRVDIVKGPADLAQEILRTQGR